MITPTIVPIPTELFETGCFVYSRRKVFMNDLTSYIDSDQPTQLMTLSSKESIVPHHCIGFSNPVGKLFSLTPITKTRLLAYRVGRRSSSQNPYVALL
jgi:hypothetical protein